MPGSFLVTRAVIFCLSASEEPSEPPSPLPSGSPFLPRVRPHLDPGIWVRLYVYNLLRRRGSSRISGLSSHLLRRLHNSQIELHAGAVPGSCSSSDTPGSSAEGDASRNIGRLTPHVRLVLSLISLTSARFAELCIQFRKSDFQPLSRVNCS